MDQKTTADARTPTVLVVEDDPLVRTILLRFLRFDGHVAVDAHDGPAAIALFDLHAGAIPLVLMDVNLPGRDGIQIAAELRRRKPGLSIIYVSGDVEQQHVGLDRGERFLHKPFQQSQLASLVKSSLDETARA
jgi:DNA-binding response OmpR family regulator